VGSGCGGDDQDDRDTGVARVGGCGADASFERPQPLSIYVLPVVYLRDAYRERRGVEESVRGWLGSKMRVALFSRRRTNVRAQLRLAITMRVFCLLPQKPDTIVPHE